MEENQKFQWNEAGIQYQELF